MERYITFVVYEGERIVNIYQLTENTRHNFKWWYGAIRDNNRGCRIDIRSCSGDRID